MNCRQSSIDVLNLSARSTHGLQRAGINTIEQMMKLSEEDLYEIPMLGKKSVEEILAAQTNLMHIDEYLGNFEENHKHSGQTPNKNYETSNLSEQEILEYLDRNHVKTSVLSLLPARTYNYLLLAGYTELSQIIFMSDAALQEIPHIDRTSAAEIRKNCTRYLRDYQDSILEEQNRNRSVQKNADNLFTDPNNRETIFKYVKENDVFISDLGLSIRAVNALKHAGFTTLSQIIFHEANDLWLIKNMGKNSVTEVMQAKKKYLDNHKELILAFCSGDKTMLYSEDQLAKRILQIFNEIGFAGLSLNDILERLDLMSESSLHAKVKHVIGSLISSNQLEYVDYRCYRVYPKFADWLATNEGSNERNKTILNMRIAGCTLEEIGQEQDITREGARQIVIKELSRLRETYYVETGLKYFDEDYYRYFYETYALDKEDCEEWFGFSQRVFNYFSLTESKPGKKNIEKSLDDPNLDVGLKLKVKNYLNRNSLLIDGVWVKRTHIELEKHLIRKFAKDKIPFAQFVTLYNTYLEDQGIDHSEDVYIADEMVRTRKNYIASSNYALWTQNENVRYYDIDGQDYTELYETLNLDSYENTGLSTLLWYQNYPELMEKYDIRDHYELHNLLRKTIAEGAFHDIHFNRMPNIAFGTFNIDAVIWDLILTNAPIRTTDLAELIYQEFGFDKATIQGSYLPRYSKYINNGLVDINQKSMSPKNREQLKTLLSDDFYYLDEVRMIYRNIDPDADIEEINAYSLKSIGFQVFTNYTIHNHPSAYEYFRNLLTKDEITDLQFLRNKYGTIRQFSDTYYALRNQKELFEYERGKLISIKRLQKVGITKSDLERFCDEVFNHAPDNEFFTINSLKREGFASDLFDFDLPDWFYGSVLISDPRFSSSQIFSAIILYKGKCVVNTKALVSEIVQKQGSIDLYDVTAEMQEVYGCMIDSKERYRIIEKIKDSDIYYDAYLERLYASAELYYQELEAAGNI